MNKLEIVATVVGLLGFVALVVGVAMLSQAAALIVGGVILIGWSWRAEHAAAVRQSPGQED
ncbi:hypothetical protein [Bordetella bronchiseptica]|uniref:hypothetical protein n=1 Tax=Bordetella bronchiseptica TaxID=518 RepID=UPI000461DBF1|nr:hypothetical protein [Bordetella bronchiseptica]KDD09932.1 hypothetical protein L522_1787 [Bordetella bronchiseptica MBORD707]